MLILSAKAFEEAEGHHAILEWPGPLCVWTGPGLSPDLPEGAFAIDFDPAPTGLAAGLRATLSRLAYFGQRPEGAVLCAARLPAHADLARLHEAAGAGDWAVHAPKSKLWRIGRRIDGILMLGAGLARSAGLIPALRALPADLADDDGALLAFEALAQELSAAQAALA